MYFNSSHNIQRIKKDSSYRLILFLLFSAFFVTESSGQQILLKQTNESGIYLKGEQIKMTVFLKDIDEDSLSVKITKNFASETENYRIAYAGKNTLLLDVSYDEPTALVCEVSCADQSASLGLVVDPENFTPGSTRPKDFDKFWKAEKKALHALNWEVQSVALADVEAGYSIADVEINCTGPKPARGYYAKPTNAEEKSLPIVLIVHAAGVKGSWCLSKPENALNYAKMGNGALCFDLNAHGMKNGQPQEYYDALEEGELKRYFYQGMENRDDYYFKGMYLRLMRTLDYLCKQPEWDGKRVIVIGESQGGGQALAAAGLDKRVSAVVATVPAMCDMGGPERGRKGGWPNPIGYNMGNEKILKAVQYFDTAHLLKNSGATIFTEIGFIDTTCPSTSVYAAINQSSGKKIIIGVPYRGHHLNQRFYQKDWEERFYQPRLKFIADFLQ